ncbi:MAG: PilT/PilU family type 4a pilus ATPase [Rickettsiales bacterium]
MEIRQTVVALADAHPLSDVHIHSDAPVCMRIHGEIKRAEGLFCAKEDVEAFFDAILDAEQKAHFAKYKDVDLAIECGPYRMRVNAYRTMRGPAAVMRKIESKIPDVSLLGLPQAVTNVTREKNGLVLVTGPTGSGKSTTLASIINSINENRAENIITIEDPIEFVHQSKKCIVSQREVGKDALSFATGLKAMLREDPDVILVGEMRDLETVSLALTAAETGHLVFGTLHTNGAPNTVNRILDVFPPAQQAQARSQLSQSLRLVATQRLLPRVDGKGGRIAAFEVMVCNNAISNLIRESKIHQIVQVMQTGRALGMTTMEDYLDNLLKQGKIRKEDIA